MTPTLTIVRGLPGSGKSTYARDLCRGDRRMCHVEADQFFLVRTANSPRRRYVFNPEMLGYAHQWCLARTRWLLSRGRSVVVANTFTTKKEMQPYFDLGYEVKVVECDGSYQNVHGVPAHTIERMRKRWEALV